MKKEDFHLSIKGQPVRYRLVLVFYLILIIPNLFLIYTLYKQQLISYESFRIFSFPILVFLLFSLFGMTLLRQAFDEIMRVAGQTKEAVNGRIDKIIISKESHELTEIVSSFNAILEQFRKNSQELNKRVRELGTLNELTELSCRMIDIDKLLDIVLERAMFATQARIGSIMLIDPDGQQLTIWASKGHKEPLLKGMKIKINDSIVDRTIREKRAVVVTDVEKDTRFLRKSRPRYRTPSFISAPLRAKDEVIGVLNVADKEDNTSFNKEDLDFLITLLGEIGFAIENARLYESLKQKIEELERTNKSLSAIGEMSASIAHELNNYLSGIFMRVQLLPDYIKANPEKALYHVNFMKEYLEKIARFITGLMDYCKVETRKVECNINGVIQNTIEFLKPQNRYDNIEFLLSLDKDLPPIFADPQQMEQVFVNLFNNAVESMGKGNIKIETRAEEEFIEISVIDEGPGIPGEIRGRIFEPRFSTKENSFGFGLATCYRIITNHEGNIQVEGDVGEGAHFRIQLPLKELQKTIPTQKISQNSSIVSEE